MRRLTRRGSLAGDPSYAAPSPRDAGSGHEPLVEVGPRGALPAAEPTTEPPAGGADPALRPARLAGCGGGRDADGQCPKPNGGVRPV
jgi:hypothetical protein